MNNYRVDKNTGALIFQGNEESKIKQLETIVRELQGTVEQLEEKVEELCTIIKRGD
mgnify:CR=1 FL=1